MCYITILKSVRTALIFATGGIFELLLQHNDAVVKKMGWTNFHLAAMSNRKDILDRLVLLKLYEPWGSVSSSPRKTVDIEDNHGCTPLWWAACNGHMDCVDVLFILGANPDHKK
jgi:ankyrin repeat protein